MNYICTFQIFKKMEKIKEIIMSIIRGTMLWFFLPFAFADLICHNKGKTIAIVCGIIALFIFGAWATSDDEPSPSEITDLTAAFNNGNLKRHKTLYIVLHHTAGPKDGRINDICRVHFGQHKWSSIGYHFFIDTDGGIYQLRDTDENCPHSLCYNDNAVAIVLNGNFSEYEPTAEQWDSALKIVRSMMKKYGLTANDVYRHGDMPNNNTECCGKFFNLEQFRKDL